MAVVRTAGTDLEDAAAVFAQVRPRLFGIAYRMLGSAMDAEDLLQEVWVRWQTADRAAVLNPAAYLATATTRLAINVSTSARARYESYVGPWLPEPVDTSADPALGAERDSALEVAVLFLLEKLTPTQRAAYVLREAFDYSYAQIAEIVRTTETAARQLVSRARKHLAAERRAPVTSPEQRRLLTAFVAAAREGDMARLEELFTQDVVSWADSGGLARASKIPVRGAHVVAKYILAFRKRYWPGVEFDLVEANGATWFRMRKDGETFGLATVSATGDGIERLLWQLNPDKLAAWR
ncbi:RNA polymerase sigma-70 factor (ECF subfamily) [Crossiella equi]|uniref:RNA polymerase sigma-70 factor (ECF subfamily) n=1 Tax=Crossiella equi TaxID=130796 RepID=A0ABS5A998_9PSEU|nr:sigma-70 family RNA polymerase sigma factor [Crossiella equi]MBP2473135.1 RNA polymerase sigma-70 factor (ECF subfamily) [Crossiella equi]